MKPSPKKERQKDFCYTHYLLPAADIHPVFVRFDYNSGRENYNYGQHLHVDHELIYVVNGKYSARLNGEGVALEPDAMLLCCPGDEHTDQVCTGLQYYTLSFHVRSAHGIGHEISLLREEVGVRDKIFNASSGIIRQTMYEVAEIMQDTAPGSSHLAQTLLQEIFWRFVLLIPDKLYSLDFYRLSEPDNFSRRFYKVLEGNPGGVLEVSDIAAELSVSISQLGKLCKLHLNASPGQLLQKFRIERVCEMLAKSNLSVGEISEVLGYKDQFTMSRTFKKQKGIAPLRWRKNAQSDADLEVSDLL